MENMVVMKQVERMMEFMDVEAREMVEKIDAKTEEDFTHVKGDEISKGRKKIDEEMRRKEKQEIVQKKMEISEIQRKARLSLLRAKDELVKAVMEEAMTSLTESLKDKKLYASLLCSLLTEGLCQIMEPVVIVRCRKEDLTMLENVIPEAVFEYEAKTNKYVNVQIDTNSWVEDESVGGVKVTTVGGEIFIDNTVAARFARIGQLEMPRVRKNLFGDIM